MPNFTALLCRASQNILLEFRWCRFSYPSPVDTTDAPAGSDVDVIAIIFTLSILYLFS